MFITTHCNQISSRISQNSWLSVTRHIATWLIFSISLGVQSAGRESEILNAQLNKEGKLLREFQLREDDLREALNAKDSQLAVLRIRIQESDQELRETKEKLERFQNENER